MIILSKGGAASNIQKMYLFKILGGVVFFGSVMMMFIESRGLSLSDIFYIHIAYVISMALFEAPTGYFADVYGRKKSLIVGSVVQLLSIVLFAVAESFWLFLVVEVLMGMALAFYSGAISALVYESLDADNRVSEYQKIWGKMQFYNFIVMALTAMIGSVVAHCYGLVYAIYINIPSVVLMFLVALSLEEPPSVKVMAKKGYAKEFASNIVETFRLSKALQLIVFYSAIVYIFNQSIYPAYQNYYDLIGVNLIWFGFIHAALQIVAGVSSFYAYRIEKALGKRTLALMLPFMVALSYLLMGSFIGVWSFVFIFFQQFVRGVKLVVVSDYINQLVGSEQRATILSMESMLSKILIAPMLLLWGVSLAFISLTETLLLFGGIGILVWIILWIFIEKLAQKDVQSK